ncbi:MAG: alpha/beta hydrolase [Oceanicaulis sp.]
MTRSQEASSAGAAASVAPVAPLAPVSLSGFFAAAFAAVCLIVLATVGAEAQERVHLTTEGSGPDIVFVPGLASPGEAFAEIGASLDGRSSYVDLAGFAGTAPVAGLDAFIGPAAQDLADALAARDMTGVVLVGHSLGGQIALQTAAAAPDRVAHVVLIDSAPFTAALMQPGADPEQVTARRPAMVEQFMAMERDALMAMMEQGLPMQVTSAEDQERVMGWIEGSDQRALAVASSEIFGGDLRPVLDGVRAPVTLIYPGQPGGPIAERYAAQYERLDRFDMHAVPDSRHFVMLDQPEAVIGILQAVVERVQK